jgi:hypothetical protein
MRAAEARSIAERWMHDVCLPGVDARGLIGAWIGGSLASRTTLHDDVIVQASPVPTEVIEDESRLLGVPALDRAFVAAASSTTLRVGSSGEGQQLDGLVGVADDRLELGVGEQAALWIEEGRAGDDLEVAGQCGVQHGSRRASPTAALAGRTWDPGFKRSSVEDQRP